METEQFEAMKQQALDAGIPKEYVDQVQLADQSQCSIGDEMDDKEKVDTVKEWAKDSFNKAKHWWKNNGFLQ